MKIKRLKSYRKKIRLNESNYPLSAYYFITICTSGRQNIFGQIESQQMNHSNFGNIALREWYNVFDRFNYAEFDIVQIMPDHFHAIILIQETGNANKIKSKSTETSKEIPTISKIIGAYKSIVANECLKSFKTIHEETKPEPKMGKIWHRSFWERIIRNEIELQNVREYIRNNPTNWSPETFQQTEM